MNEMRMIELRDKQDWDEPYIRSIAEHMDLRSIVVLGVEGGEKPKMFCCCWTNDADSARMINAFLEDSPEVGGIMMALRVGEILSAMEEGGE